MGDRCDLVGFVFQHGNNDFELWQVQLSEEDENAIMDILMKYDTCGCSVRGDRDMRISEGF